MRALTIARTITAVVGLIAGGGILYYGIAVAHSREYKGDVPHVLTVVNSKYNGTPVETVAFQEFSTKMRCEYALGFVKGITDTTAECMEK